MKYLYCSTYGKIQVWQILKDCGNSWVIYRRRTKDEYSKLDEFNKHMLKSKFNDGWTLSRKAAKAETIKFHNEVIADAKASLKKLK